MNLLDKARRFARNRTEAVRLLARLVDAVENDSSLFNRKQNALIEGLKNQSSLLNDKLNEVIGLQDEQNRKLAAVIEGMNNQSNLFNDKLNNVVDGQGAQIERQDAIIEGLQNQSSLLNDKLNELLGIKADRGATQQARREPPGESGQGAPARRGSRSRSSFQDAMQTIPLLLDERTYNTAHPDYDATLVRNFPGRVFNGDRPCGNAVFDELKKLADGPIVAGSSVPDSAWKPVLEATLEEAMTVPDAHLVFERRAFIEQYMRDLGRKHRAHYVPGWVNLDDALFLYWLVRRLRPRTVVQTGVCNGLSSAFMVLALARNGQDGKLHVIDLPAVFDPSDPAWKVKDKVYGVVIPEGKSSGWMVPEAHADRFEVWNGDAKVLLPKLVDQIDGIDMFYHDSDHTYDHMMFEFREARRKLRPGGLIVADDISWNSSLWDFADKEGVPAYNFKGAVGVAFL